MELLKDINYKKMITSRIVVTVIMIFLELLLLFGVFWRAVQYSGYVMMLFSFLSGLYVIYLVCKDGNASYRIGWMLVILALPPFGVFIYMLWGDKKPSKKLERKLRRSYAAFAEFSEKNAALYDALEKENPRVAATTRYIQKTSTAPLWDKTAVTYYAIGEDMFEAMLESIEQAKHYIFLEYFIVEEGKMWGRMLEALLKKAKEGVEIRMLYDDMGSVALLPFGYAKKLEKMDPHFKCIPFNPVVPFLAMVMNNRDHRKILVVDGEVGFTGGINLADEYINEREKYGHWKDTGLKLVGGAVLNLAVMFMEMWNASSKEKLTEKKYLADLPTFDFSSECAPKGFVQPYGDDPLDNENVGEDVYLEILNQAEHYVYITTPYLILDDEMKSALMRAAKRGVDVRIITPGVPDKKVIFRLTRANYLPLLEAGVQIYEYTPGFVHAKSFLADDKMGVVGTINLDYRSLYLHFECGAFMYDVPALLDLKKDMLEMFDMSHRIRKEDVHTKPLGRLFDGLLRVMAPLL